jgi:protein TonB
VSFGIHAAGVVGLVLLPAFSASELPPAPAPPLPPLPPIPVGVRVQIERPVLPPPRRPSGGGVAVAPFPRPQPAEPTAVSDAPLIDSPFDPLCCGVDEGQPGEDPGVGVGPGTGLLSIGAASPPPPLVRAGGEIRPPRKVAGADPVYPPLAKNAGIQGIVILECTIGPDGRVSGIRVLRSHPLLERAAIAAVEGWSYTPTLLNGVPVSVLMTVTVDFRLRR